MATHDDELVRAMNEAMRDSGHATGTGSVGMASGSTSTPPSGSAAPSWEDEIEDIDAALGTLKPDIEEAEPENPRAIKIRPIVKDGNTKLFSDLFGWVPTSIPDIEMRVFEASEWDVSVRERIPALAAGYAWHREYAEQLAMSYHRGGPVLLHGPTGTGKTELVKQLAAMVRMPFLKVSCHKQMEQSAFLGSNRVEPENGVPKTIHTDTDTTLAARHGGLLCIDEAFRSPILMCIQSLLEVPHTLTLQDSHGVNRMLTPKMPLSIMLTDNTNGTGDDTGNYVAEVQDISTLDRVKHSLFITYLPEREERALMKRHYTNIPKIVRDDMVSVANEIRAAFLDGKLMQTFSLRALLNWADNASTSGDVVSGFQSCYFNKLSKTDQAIAYNCFRSVFGAKEWAL